MAEKQYIPHFEPSCKGWQHDLLQITKSNMQALAMWRQQYAHLLMAAHDEIGVPNYVDVGGVQCYNTLPNFDSLGHTEGSAVYEFFKFNGFDDQAFADIQEAWEHDDVEHLSFFWSPQFTMTLADFEDFMDFVRTTILVRIKTFSILHKNARYSEDKFPDEVDRPARSLFDQEPNLTLITNYQKSLT